ncbi:MAG TPA: tetratricopeptide repeat protein, partial [Flavobacterium sp.]|nr:tetratricopeptide repeat protein [Flavobacterium sp.]
MTVMRANYNDSEKSYYDLNEMLGELALKNYKKNNNTPKVKKEYAIWLAAYHQSLASHYSHTGQSEKGLVSIDKAIVLLKSIQSEELYIAYLAKAVIYIGMKQETKAIPLIFDSLKFFEKNTKYYNDQVATSYIILGKVYFEQKKYEKTISCNLTAIKYYQTSKEPAQYTAYMKCGAYLLIGDSYNMLKKYKEAANYYNLSLDLSKKEGVTMLLCRSLSSLANVQLSLSNLDEAEKLYAEALSMNSASMPIDNRVLTNIYAGLGDLYLKKRNYAKASEYAGKAFEISKKTGTVSEQIKFADLTYQISIATKNFEKALEMYKFNEKMIDSSEVEASKNALAQQLLKYNFEKKELKLKLDAEKKTAVKNNWLIGLSGVVLLLVLGLFFYYRNNKQKQAIAVLEKDQIKQKLLVSQMNPHFIFNSIENIQQLIYDKKDTDAVNYLSKFSVLTRQILENSNENYISLSEEVGMIGNYLSIQQLLYNNKFDFTIVVDDAIDIETIFLPPMLTQPFIENAIKHGLSNKEENGMVDIRFYLKEA